MASDHAVLLTTVRSKVSQEMLNTQTSTQQPTRPLILTTTVPQSRTPQKDSRRGKRKYKRREKKKLKRKIKRLLRKKQRNIGGFMDLKISNSTITTGDVASQYIGNGAGIMDHHKPKQNDTVKMEFEDFESVLHETDKLISERIEEREHEGDLFTQSQYLTDISTTTSPVSDLDQSSFSTDTTSVTSTSVVVTAADEDVVTESVTSTTISDIKTTTELPVVEHVTESVASKTNVTAETPKAEETPVEGTTVLSDNPKTDNRGHGTVVSDTGLVVTDNGDIQRPVPERRPNIFGPDRLGPYPDEEDDFHDHEHVFGGRQRKKKRRWRMRCRMDYMRLPMGRMCCINTVRCFDHLPELLDEIDHYEQEHTGRQHVCSHAKNSLTCMSKTLKKPECRRTAKAINDKFKPELESITSFYSPNCLLKNGNTTGRHGHGQNSKVVDTLQVGVIGAASGVALLLIVLIVVCIFWTRSRRSRQNESNVAAKGPDSVKKASSRYKDLGLVRQRSEVYAEIDDRSLNDIRNDSAGSRPLPSAPNETITEDRSGYLTPQNSGQELAKQDQNGSNGGYAVLDVEANSRYKQLYSTLKDGQPPEEEGEYVAPDHDENSPKRRSGHINFTSAQVNANDKKSDEPPYHMYFVLEKETDG